MKAKIYYLVRVEVDGKATYFRKRTYLLALPTYIRQMCKGYKVAIIRWMIPVLANKKHGRLVMDEIRSDHVILN